MILTCHARQRMCQRDITLDDLRYALAYGRPARGAHYRLYIVETHTLQRIDRRLQQRLRGLCVVCAGGEVVVTAYRRTTTATTNASV